MQLYIANVSHHNHIVNCRLPETTKVWTKEIPMGRQAMVGDRSGLTKEQVDKIIEQMGLYGLRSFKEAMNSEGVVPLIYSTDGPVSSDSMMKVIHRNRGILQSSGKRRREEAALAANVMMNTEETPLRKLEMSIEEATPGSLPSEGAPIAEGFRVDNAANTSENKRKPRSLRGQMKPQ